MGRLNGKALLPGLQGGGTVNRTLRNHPGCLVRWDYLEIMYAVRDNPGILRSDLFVRIHSRHGSSDGYRRLLDELAEAGLMECRTESRTYRYFLTPKGVRALAAIDSVSEEVGL